MAVWFIVKLDGSTTDSTAKERENAESAKLAQMKELWSFEGLASREHPNGYGIRPQIGRINT